MKLDKFHVLVGEAATRQQCTAIASARVCRRAGEIAPTKAAINTHTHTHTHTYWTPQKAISQTCTTTGLMFHVLHDATTSHFPAAQFLQNQPNLTQQKQRIKSQGS